MSSSERDSLQQILQFIRRDVLSGAEEKRFRGFGVPVFWSSTEVVRADDLRVGFGGRKEVSGVQNGDADFVDARPGSGCAFDVDAEEYSALFRRSF